MKISIELNEEAFNALVIQSQYQKKVKGADGQMVDNPVSEKDHVAAYFGKVVEGAVRRIRAAAPVSGISVALE
jgi:hypothetical protein